MCVTGALRHAPPVTANQGAGDHPITSTRRSYATTGSQHRHIALSFLPCFPLVLEGLQHAWQRSPPSVCSCLCVCALVSCCAAVCRRASMMLPTTCSSSATTTHCDEQLCVPPGSPPVLLSDKGMFSVVYAVRLRNMTKLVFGAGHTVPC